MSKLQSAAFLAGGLLMVASAGCFVFFLWRPVVCWTFLLGAVLFAFIQAMQTYTGEDLTLRRLKRIQGLAGLLFLLAGIDMADTVNGFFRPLFANYENYLAYVYNKWVVLLLIAAIVEVYTVHRIDHELSKKNIKQ